MTTERERALALVGDASTRLVRTVDGFHGDDWSAPSLLPGWTRAHVVAHLALNAEGMTRALRGVVADDGDHGPSAMYDSDEKRDSDIAELATAEASRIRERLMAGTTILDEAMAALPQDAWEQRVDRTPGGRTIRADAFPGMRVRELEIHHVDLGAGYTVGDWSVEFAELLLDAMAKRLDPVESFEAKPLDSARTWVFGSSDAEYAVPVVTGPAGEIGWWLTGREAPESLHCSRGELPTIEGW